MIDKRKEWLYCDDVRLQWEYHCNKCGWNIDVNEPLIRTETAWSQSKFYHTYCYEVKQ